MHRALLVCLFLILSVGPGCAAMQQYMGGENGGGMTTDKVVAGLTDALTVGSKRSVDETSREGGFLNNPLIKINMPSQLSGMMNALRQIGLNRQVDNFEVAMNRAAEKAAGEALGVFVDTVKGMTFADAWGILNGNETAATDYFRGRTTSVLAERFRPIVRTKMNEVGLYSAYEFLNTSYAKLPFANGVAFDLETFVVDRALDGLFKTLAQEEAKIRGGLNFRTTPLLREVFGYLDTSRAAGRKAEPTSGTTSTPRSSGTTTGKPTGTVGR